MIGPDPEPAVLRKTITSDAGAGEDYVGMRRPDFDGIQHFDQIDTVAFGKKTPFMEVGKQGRPIRVLHDLAGFAFDGAVQNREGVLPHVDNIREEGDDASPRLFIDAARHAPEIAD